MKTAIRICLLTLITLLGLTACTDDANTEYARIPAFLRVQPVSTVQPLNAALNSPGVFCKVTFSTNYYHFENNHGQSAQTNRTALDVYGKPQCLNGFIIGIPNVPDLSGVMQPVAFDLACPTCFSEMLIQRSLTINARGEAHCSRCSTTYDLNNMGFPKDGPGNYVMLRYHLQYGNDAMIVRN